jgi:hypothetical protein
MEELFDLKISCQKSCKTIPLRNRFADIPSRERNKKQMRKCPDNPTNFDEKKTSEVRMAPDELVTAVAAEWAEPAPCRRGCGSCSHG